MSHLIKPCCVASPPHNSAAFRLSRTCCLKMSSHTSEAVTEKESCSPCPPPRLWLVQVIPWAEPWLWSTVGALALRTASWPLTLLHNAGPSVCHPHNPDSNPQASSAETEQDLVWTTSSKGGGGAWESRGMQRSEDLRKAEWSPACPLPVSNRPYH